MRKQQEELEEIDQIMEDIIGDDDEEGDGGKDEDQSFEPSQPFLLSEKANLLKDALKKNS